MREKKKTKKTSKAASPKTSDIKAIADILECTQNEAVAKAVHGFARLLEQATVPGTDICVRTAGGQNTICDMHNL